MTTATLTFDEEFELLDAINGYKYKLALGELDKFLTQRQNNTNMPKRYVKIFTTIFLMSGKW